MSQTDVTPTPVPAETRRERATARPVILAVDDEPEVLRAVERDLRKRYAGEMRIVRAASGEEAAETLEKLVGRGDPIALILSDQRMPGMGGVEFLQKTKPLAPMAKRVLLTAYADTAVAIQAINTVRLDHYLTKPWDPPEQLLYPVLDDLLEDWRASYRPGLTGLRVIGHRWSPHAHRIKDFLARNLVPYVWHDIETTSGPNTEALRGTYCSVGDSHCTLVLLQDGGQLVNPSNQELAERIGLQTEAKEPFYDLVIVGGGPAGLAAAVYGASEGLRTVLVEPEAPGGQAGTSSRIENYLGFPSGLSGADLARRGAAQARRFGTEILAAQEAVGLETDGLYRLVKLSGGETLRSYTVLISTGVSYERLQAPGVEEFTGRGVFYGAAMSETEVCRDQEVVIVGGGNSAGQAAMYFSEVCKAVHMVVRGESLEERMSQYLVDRLRGTENIRIHLQAEVVEARGGDVLEAVTLVHNESGERQEITTPGLFIFIGAKPRTDWLHGVLERDEQGYLLTGSDLAQGGTNGAVPKGWPLRRLPFLLESNIPGVFVAGDVRRRSVKRVASAVGEGSIAVQFIHEHLAQVR